MTRSYTRPRGYFICWYGVSYTCIQTLSFKFTLHNTTHIVCKGFKPVIKETHSEMKTLTSYCMTITENTEIAQNNQRRLHFINRSENTMLITAYHQKGTIQRILILLLCLYSWVKLDQPTLLDLYPHVDYPLWTLPW